MGRESWNSIKQSKSFYVNIYRRGIFVLIISLGINAALSLVIYYLYFHQPIRDFYATNGITAPEKLNPMNERNYSATALLEPDSINNDVVKIIPQ